VHGVHRKPVGYFAASHTVSEEQLFLKRKRNCSFRFRSPYFIPVESQRKLSGHEKEKFEFDLRNFGSRDAA